MILRLVSQHWMAALVITAGIVAATFVARMFVSSEKFGLRESSAGQDIELVPPSISYRGSGNTEKVLVEVVLHNRGHRRINILAVESSCGCTLVNSLPARTIEARNQLPLSIEISPPVFGSRVAVVTITTDSHYTPKVYLPIQMTGKQLSPPYMEMAPSEIQFDSTPGTKGAQRNKLINFSGLMARPCSSSLHETYEA